MLGRNGGRGGGGGGEGRGGGGGGEGRGGGGGVMGTYINFMSMVCYQSNYLLDRRFGGV